MKESRIIIEPGFFLFLSLGLLFVSIPWLLAWLTAAAIHEICHILALRLCDCEIDSVRIGPGGAKIQGEIPQGISGMVCALAGPAGGLLLLAFLHIIPRVALCGLFQSVYNLLPIYPLDGGRALQGLLTQAFGNQRGKLFSRIIGYLFLALLFGVSLYAAVGLKFGIWLMFPTLALIFKNTPCKRSRLGVQYLQ